VTKDSIPPLKEEEVRSQTSFDLLKYSHSQQARIHRNLLLRNVQGQFQ
jgi:hypothetical protein